MSAVVLPRSVAEPIARKRCPTSSRLYSFDHDVDQRRIGVSGARRAERKKRRFRNVNHARKLKAHALIRRCISKTRLPGSENSPLYVAQGWLASAIWPLTGLACAP
jgi:hypothetical protein